MFQQGIIAAASDGVDPYWIIGILIGIITTLIYILIYFYRQSVKTVAKLGITLDELPKILGAFIKVASDENVELRHKIELHSQCSDMHFKEITNILNKGVKYNDKS